MEQFIYPQDLVYDMKSHKEMPYDKKISFLKNQHLGQLKLFSNELCFVLTYCCDENILVKKKIILYVGAGAGPGIPSHLYYLAKMFPTFEWHLFDLPDRFDPKLETVKNIFLEKSYFEDRHLEVYKELVKDDTVDLYFISDIRDLSYNSKEWDLEEELKVLDDMALQKTWVETLKPKFSMLKLRFPFPEPEVIKRLGTDEVPYLYGTIYKQPWSRGKSIETRLVIPGNDIREIYYNLHKYESQLFYHNAVLRQKDYVFPLSDKLNGKKVSPNLIVNTRYDCAFIITLLFRYFHRSNPKIDADTLLKNVTKILNVITEYKD